MRSPKDKRFERLAEILDRIIEKLDELPQVFAAEEELAQHFDLSDPSTKDEVFRRTVSLLGTLKSSALIAQTVLIQSSLPDSLAPVSSPKNNKYATTVRITCLPQENSRWVATAFIGLSDSILAYGETKEQAIAHALRAIANRLEREQEQF